MSCPFKSSDWAEFFSLRLFLCVGENKTQQNAAYQEQQPRRFIGGVFMRHDVRDSVKVSSLVGS